MTAIRIAEVNDLEQIYQLITDLEETKLDIAIFTDVYLANIENPLIYYYVYEMDHEIIGFISLHIQILLHHASKISEIQEFIVMEKARGKGIGRELFDKVKEISIQNGCTQMEVCCNQKRTSSHKFYESCGMTNHHYKFCIKL